MNALAGTGRRVLCELDVGSLSRMNGCRLRWGGLRGWHGDDGSSRLEPCGRLGGPRHGSGLPDSCLLRSRGLRGADCHGSIRRDGVSLGGEVGSALVVIRRKRAGRCRRIDNVDSRGVRSSACGHWRGCAVGRRGCWDCSLRERPGSGGLMKPGGDMRLEERRAGGGRRVVETLSGGRGRDHARKRAERKIAYGFPRHCRASLWRRRSVSRGHKMASDVTRSRALSKVSDFILMGQARDATVDDANESRADVLWFRYRHGQPVPWAFLRQDLRNWARPVNPNKPCGRRIQPRLPVYRDAWRTKGFGRCECLAREGFCWGSRVS